MEQKLVQKISYSYDFKAQELKPLIETHAITKKEDFLEVFGAKEGMVEDKRAEPALDVASLIAEVQDDISSLNTTSSAYVKNSTNKEVRHSKHYAIMYFNPATKKAEVLDVASDISIKDYAQEKVEESTATGSAYPVYSFIASPIIRRKINPQKLQEIIENAEYDTPPRFGGAAVVKVTKGKKPEIVPADQIVVKKVITRKEDVEAKIDREISTFDRVAQQIRRGKAPEKSIVALPPISRARFRAAVKKGHIDEKTLLLLLEKDLTFLKGIKKKIQNMSLEDLIEMVKAMGQLKDKGKK